MDGLILPGIHADPQGIPGALDLGDEDRLPPLQDPHVHRLLGPAAQLHQVVGAQVEELVLLGDPLTDLIELPAQAIAAALLILFNVSVKLQGVQQPVDGALPHLQFLAELADAQSLAAALLGQEVDDLNGFHHGLDRVFRLSRHRTPLVSPRFAGGMALF